MIKSTTTTNQKPRLNVNYLKSGWAILAFLALLPLFTLNMNKSALNMCTMQCETQRQKEVFLGCIYQEYLCLKYLSSMVTSKAIITRGTAKSLQLREQSRRARFTHIFMLFIFSHKQDMCAIHTPCPIMPGSPGGPGAPGKPCNKMFIKRVRKKKL